MSRLSILAGVLLTGLATTLVLPAGAAQAAVICAPDAWEIDDRQETRTPIAVGETVQRAICQERVALPGKPLTHDLDNFEFTAEEGKAYAVEAVEIGAGLRAVGGGLRVIVSGPGVEDHYTVGRDLFVTNTLSAGAYRVLVVDSDLATYPGFVLGTKTVEGDAGRYSIRLTESAPRAAVTGVSIAPGAVPGDQPTTATVTFDRPTPSNGVVLHVNSSWPEIAGNISSLAVPPGVTEHTLTIRTKRVSIDREVTISARVVDSPAVHSASFTILGG